MDEALRRFVRERAGHRCEYYGILQAHVPFAAFHIDHIIDVSTLFRTQTLVDV